MTPQAALVELLARLGAANGASVFVTEEELCQWPVAAVVALKSQKLIARARPAVSAVCSGCERDCMMPVHTLPTVSGSAASFIVCDKRSDINRVTVPVERLKQWQCTVDMVCGFIAASLGLRRSDKRRLARSDLLEIGVATGDKRNQMLCLQIAGELMLVAGGNQVPLVEFISYGEDSYSVDGAMVRMLVDASTTADNRYTPSNARREIRKQETQAMHKRWQKAYRDLRNTHKDKSETWCSQQIAKMPISKGRSAGTIKKHMLS